MYLKKEIYNNFLQQLSKNERIPEAIFDGVKNLFQNEKKITSAQLKSIIDKAFNNDDKN